MRLDTVFRISLHATLAVASVGLAFTEEPYLPSVMYFLAAFLVLQVVAFVLEGRWELTLKASNVLGLVIAAASGLWIAVSLAAASNPWVDSAPYPIALLPFGGPVLMLVLLAKLFRPKQGSDYWWLHLIGLMEVALACILANELAFSLWLFAYLACALWSLTLFTLYRARQQAGPAERPPGPGWGLGRSLGRAVVVIGLGLLLFLLTPRFGNRNWDLLHPGQTRGQMETGYSPTMDLNQTGEVKVSEEEAFQVRVETAEGQPKRDLSPQQRWRGSTLDLYESGRWGGRRRFLFAPGMRINYPPIPEGGRDDLPRLGPDAFLVFFDIDNRRVRGLPLAEPVAPPHAGDVPVRSLNRPERWGPFFRERDSCLGAPPDRSLQNYRYVQVVPAGEEPPPADLITPEYHNRLLYQPVPGIARWTGELLQRLVAEHKLTDADVAFGPAPFFADGRALLPANRARVARAVTDYFTHSGDFAYRLELKRDDRTLDPIEDFLRNTRAGFCEHYATALVLVLRSVGIPARAVVGFRGAEPLGDPPAAEGVYVVRQSDAHSWVEALLPRRGADGQPELYWQTLDPTPAQEAPTTLAFSWAKWWRARQGQIREFWRTLILDYNGDRQQDTLARLGKYLGWGTLEAAGTWLQEEVFSRRRWPWIAVPPALGLGAWALRRRRKASPAGAVACPAGDLAFYRHWLALVARYCRLERQPAQTPWELAAAVRLALPGSAALAEGSRRIVDRYYRVSFGRQPLTPDENAALERQVADLEPHFTARSGRSRRPAG